MTEGTLLPPPNPADIPESAAELNRKLSMQEAGENDWQGNPDSNLPVADTLQWQVETVSTVEIPVEKKIPTTTTTVFTPETTTPPTTTTTTVFPDRTTIPETTAAPFPQQKQDIGPPKGPEPAAPTTLPGGF